eukprot:6287943-Lingulodinium_polyedra.AAC.1
MLLQTALRAPCAVLRLRAARSWAREQDGIVRARRSVSCAERRTRRRFACCCARRCAFAKLLCAEGCLAEGS